jgi:hypothetical protein
MVHLTPFAAFYHLPVLRGKRLDSTIPPQLFWLRHSGDCATLISI